MYEIEAKGNAPQELAVSHFENGSQPGDLGYDP